jgi:LCP family protein required for cell wall assembly
MLVALGYLAFFVIAGGAATFAAIQHQLDSNIERFADPFANLTNRPPIVTPSQGSSEKAQPLPVNILMVGTDSRISAGDPSKWSAGGQRTDAIMLVHIPADRSGAFVFSIPRDSWVAIPGHGTAKVNAAFSYGGPALLIQTIEQLTNVRIDHLVIADFNSFTALTDSLGGVEITAPSNVYDNGILVTQKGTHLLNGNQALTYVRERHGLPRGDFDRVQRQQNWMRAIMSKALSQGTVTDPTKLLTFLDTVTKSVSVDQGFRVQDMESLGLSMRNVRAGDVQFHTVPFTGTGTSSDGQSIVVLNRAKFDPLMAAIASDDVGAYLADHMSDLDTLPDVPR